MIDKPYYESFSKDICTEFVLWIHFIDNNGYGNILKCGRKMYDDIMRFKRFFITMFPNYNIELIRGMTKNSFIINIIQNVKSSD